MKIIKIVLSDLGLARIADREGHYPKARGLAEKVLEKQKESYQSNQNHIEIAETKRILERALLHQGLLSKASQEFEESINIYGEQNLLNHPSYFFSLYNQALIKMHFGQYKLAEELCSQALVGFKNLYDHLDKDKEHPNIRRIFA